MDLNNWAISEGASGLAYITFEKENNKINGKGPIAKFFSENAIKELIKISNMTEKGLSFFVCNKEKEAINFAGIVRQKIAEELKLIMTKDFKFCWITDYPMYEYDEKEKKLTLVTILFNATSEISDFDKADPLKILAYQYDLVCNGYELSSGAIEIIFQNIYLKFFQKLDTPKKW